MADFLDEVLPVTVRMGASETEDYAVRVVTTESGAEHRRLLHGFPVRRWQIQYTLAQGELAAKVKALYDRALGRYAGFRVLCKDDSSTAADGLSAPTALDHPLPKISAGVYQLVKRYGLGAPALPSVGYPVRTLFKPIAGSVLIAKNGVVLSSGVSVDHATGRVTISPAPADGDAITGGCRFHIPARFDSPLVKQYLAPDVRETGVIDVVELLNP